MTARTTDPAWRARVVEMIEKCLAHQDEFYYRTTLPDWEKELASIKRDEEEGRQCST